MERLARNSHCDSMQTDMAIVQLQADYLNQWRQKLFQHPQWSAVQQIGETLADQGFQCCLVGGSVRDYLLNLTPTDLDLVTNATPEQIRPLFQKTLDMGVRFGVSQIVLNDEVIDLATFRSEDSYFDGRHPERIIFSTMEEDFKRRDFTINSLYLSLQTWELHDFCNGISDIRQKILRTIGEAPKRFLEDYLRLLRAVRFATRFQLTIEPQTQIAIQTSAQLLTKLSQHRTSEELKKGFQLQQRADYLQLLNNLHLWPYLFPKIPFHKLELDHQQTQELIQKSTWPSFLAALYLTFSPMPQTRQTQQEKTRQIESFFSTLLLLKQEKKSILAHAHERHDEFIFREFLAKTQI